jgi:hypothetical protein
MSVALVAELVDEATLVVHHSATPTPSVPPSSPPYSSSRPSGIRPKVIPRREVPSSARPSTIPPETRYYMRGVRPERTCVPECISIAPESLVPSADMPALPCGPHPAAAGTLHHDVTPQPALVPEPEGRRVSQGAAIALLAATAILSSLITNLIWHVY